MKDYKEVISSALKELGIPASLSGYHYARYAIELIIQDIRLINSITKVIYPKVAKEFNTKPSRVERGIRTAIEAGWYRGNTVFADKLFGYSVNPNNGRPTNGEFVATVADYIMMQEHSQRKAVTTNEISIDEHTA